MNSEEIYSKLDEIKKMVSRYAKPDGTINVDSIRVKVALEFCSSELEKAFITGQHTTNA